LHGDHALCPIKGLLCILATVGSHEVANPCTTLAKGLAYGLYSLCTIDIGGDRGSAE
jgi:hypothetical protein